MPRCQLRVLPAVDTVTVIEICVDTLAGVEAARECGADRVELCRELWCGGLTPPDDVIRDALPACPVDGLQVLVRSRPGNFVHTADEVEGMCADIERIAGLFSATSIPCGFVVGALSTTGLVDEEAAARFRTAAGQYRLTFHRAFDSIEDKPAALETLVRLGYQRVLTTGGSTPVADTEGLADLVRRGADRIIVLASGGLRSGNVGRVLRESRAHEVHMRAPLSQHFGSAADPPARTVPEGTDPDEVARIVHAVRGASNVNH